VLAVRVFANDTLHLRVGGSYASLAHLDAEQIVHVVAAAYRLRLEPYTWWFPIVGRVPYKGFFSQSAATAEAEELERAGYDTYVRPSVAFSTLGWFADPLLSTVLRYDHATLANLIIHELLHNTSYIGGHADFDESFANFVGHRGAILFFAARGDAAALRQASREWNDALQFSDFLGRFTAHLRDAYAAGATAQDRQRLFSEAQDQFRHVPLQTGMYKEFGSRPLNNAVILHYLMYADRLRTFEDLFYQENADLTRTIQTVLEAVRRGGDPFAAVQAALRSPETVRSGLDGAEPPDAVADGEHKHGERQRRGRHQRRCDTGLCDGRERRVVQPAHEPRVHRPRLQHDDGADEGHAEDHVDEPADAGRHLGGVVGVELGVRRADGEPETDNAEGHAEQGQR
jgi:predicted aminopeptidase